MSEAELRAMVREVLRETLGRRDQTKAVTEPKTEAVRIANDADLSAFVQRLVKLLDDPAEASGVRLGQRRFTLGAAATAHLVQEKAVAGPSAGSSIVLDGTVTEAKINKCAGAGAVVVAGDAVITPLARDRARALGLKIERKR